MASAMTLDSPWRRTPMRRASPVHSIHTSPHGGDAGEWTAWCNEERFPLTGPAEPSHLSPRGRGRGLDAWLFLLMGEFETHFAVAFWIIGPLFADFDEEEEVDRHLVHFHEFAAGFRADGLDGLTASAEHDLLVAVAGDIDHLIDLVGAVLLDLETLGFDRGVVGDLVVDAQEELLARDLGGGDGHGEVCEV